MSPNLAESKAFRGLRPLPVAHALRHREILKVAARRHGVSEHGKTHGLGVRYLRCTGRSGCPEPSCDVLRELADGHSRTHVFQPETVRRIECDRCLSMVVEETESRRVELKLPRLRCL